jgi:serine/threonine protein kinase
MHAGASYLDTAQYINLTKDLRLRRTVIWDAARHGDIRKLAWITNPDFVDCDSVDCERHYTLHMAALVALAQEDEIPVGHSVVDMTATPPSFKARRRRINGWDRPWRANSSSMTGLTAGGGSPATAPKEAELRPLSGLIRDFREFGSFGEPGPSAAVEAAHQAEVDRVARTYEVGELLGHGAFGAVYLVTERQSGQQYAMKEVALQPGDQAEREAAKSEAYLLRKLGHKNIVNLVETFESPRALWIIEEWCRGGELTDHLARGTYSEHAVASVMVQLLEALQYLHSHGVVHRDVKPENLLVLDGDLLHDAPEQLELKLCDFGLAAQLQEGGLAMGEEELGDELLASPQLKADVELTETCGTPAYVAPEVWAGAGYGPEADVWSAGVTLFQMLAGATPFDGSSLLVLKHQVQAFDPAQAVVPLAMAEGGKELLVGMLQPDPTKRLSAGEALRHPWLTDSLLHPLVSSERVVAQAAHQRLHTDHLDTVANRDPRRRLRKAADCHADGWVGYYLKHAVTRKGVASPAVTRKGVASPADTTSAAAATSSGPERARLVSKRVSVLEKGDAWGQKGPKPTPRTPMASMPKGHTPSLAERAGGSPTRVSMAERKTPPTPADKFNVFATHPKPTHY